MIFIFLIVFLQPVDLQEDQDLQGDRCPRGTCTPPIGDLMLGREAGLSSSSTCGLNGPQKYCIIGYLQEDQKCFVCDSTAPYDSHRHPNSHRIDNVVATFGPDRKRKWWQSENGVHEVSIRLDLETVFQFSHLVLTFKTFRPAAMLVERSQDFGRTWKVSRYFAADCALHFPSVSPAPANGVDHVVCDSRYSGPEPSTDGEVVLKALDPVFQIDDPYAPNIQDLITLTNIRVNFTRLFTLGDTLLSRRRRRNPREKYYYSLYNMVVRGSCFCHGHARRCAPVAGSRRGDVFQQPGVVGGRCVCQHNTAGENCEHCQEFHHDSPWRPGGEHAEGICKRCNCHGHSDSCHFDEARYEATGGASGGVCDNCRHDRAGPQCERCRDFLYRDPQKSEDDPEACIPCDCDRRGALSGGLCEVTSGRCVCKQNVVGERCDLCRAGFYGLREDDPVGCQECHCHPLGSVTSCDALTGECKCDRWATGVFCDRCVDGMWGLGSSGFRCSPCDCDIGGARDSSCSPDGQCNCLPNMIGRRCSDPAPGYFLPSLNYFLYEAELAAPLPGGRLAPLSPDPPSSLLNPGVLPQCEKFYREQGYDFSTSNGQVVLVRRTRRGRRQEVRSSFPLDPGHDLQLIPRQGLPGQPVTWTGLGLVRVLEGAGLRIIVDNLFSSTDYYRLVIHYEPESPSDWLASFSVVMVAPGQSGCSSQSEDSRTLALPGSSRGAILDTALCLNAGGRYFIDVVFMKQPNSEGSHILIDSVGLIPVPDSFQDVCSLSDLDDSRHFHCIGLDPEGELEVCQGLVKSLSAHVHRGAIACSCNMIGSLGPACSKVGGACECKPNVIGQCCDRCAPLAFGFNADGCKRCECDTQGSASPLCDKVTGQCACRPEATGHHCDRCQMGLWDFPRCRPCECNGRSENCDSESGECANCQEQTAGPHCDRCVDGYYGDPVSGQPCQPCLCPDIQGGERFFATSCRFNPQSLSVSCMCNEGHTGPHCDRCSPGYYGDLSLPGARCQECLCNNNVASDDGAPCDSFTGECLRCLYNTTGPRCQHCRPGYYGNAIGRDCKECLCDRRGTQVTLCPLGSPCFCNQTTGQCPCRPGVAGDLCNYCKDGFWNLDGASGCQPCNCDAANSVSNICNKLTGQCPCRPEFGGQQCDECGENHFGTPDLQCLSCDCNLEGSRRPACDAETGECLCRRGVTGIFCQECAIGFDSAFPMCKECHACTALWGSSVTEVRQAAQLMTALLPHGNGEPRPTEWRWQRIQEMERKMEMLAGLSGGTMQTMEELEQLHLKIRNMKDAVDPNKIQIDSSRLLNTELDLLDLNLHQLLDQIRTRVSGETRAPDQEQGELGAEIQRLHGSFMLDEKRVQNATRVVEDSIDTRLAIKRKLGASGGRGLSPLKSMVNHLNEAELNQRLCGGLGGEDCSGCGGALCGTATSKCGGPDCAAFIPISQEASESAERTGEELDRLESRLQRTKSKMVDTRQEAHHTKLQVRILQNQINGNAENLTRDKDQAMELIRQVKVYLTDDQVSPDHIERISKGVLSFQFQASLDQVLAMVWDIADLVQTSIRSQLEPKDFQDQAHEALEHLKEAGWVQKRAQKIDVTQVLHEVYQVETLQDGAKSRLAVASRDADRVRGQIQETRDRLEDVESKVDNRHGNLLDDVHVLEKKMDVNKDVARNARETALEVLANAEDTHMDLVDLVKQFQDLQQRQNHQAADRVKNLVTQVQDLKTQLEDQLDRIGDTEQKIQALVQRKNQKVSEVSDLLKEVDSVRQEILSRAKSLATCTS